MIVFKVRRIGTNDFINVRDYSIGQRYYHNNASFITKIIKNNLRYKGTIHEYIFNENRDLRLHLTNEMQLIHTGYSKEISQSKVKRNLKILNLIENDLKNTQN